MKVTSTVFLIFVGRGQRFAHVSWLLNFLFGIDVGIARRRVHVDDLVDDLFAVAAARLQGETD